MAENKSPEIKNQGSESSVAPSSDVAYHDPSLVGKLGHDSRTGAYGIVRSPDNGQTWILTDTVWGHVFDEGDINNLWENGTSKLVKSEVNSATAEIPAVKSNIDEALQRADEAIKQSTTNSEAIININSAASAAKSDANVALQNAVADFNKEKSANQSAYAALHSSVASNQADIDSTIKSLAGLSTNLKQYAQDAVSQGKTIAELKQNQSDVSATVASVEGNVNQLKVDTKNIQATASDNKSDIANLQISASSASVAIKDANSNAAVAVATASQASVELQDANSNITAVQATAEGLQGTVANAQSDINQVKADAKGIHEQITNANSQIATINTNVNGLQTSVSQVTSSVNDVSKTVQANKTAIDQNTKAIALKANQTSVDDLNKAVSSQTASLTVMNNAISTKVTSADVEKTIDGKGYVTKDFVESSLTQNAKSLSESISSIDGKVQNITADVNGLQATVKNKADVSQITQLNNLISTKVNQDDYKSAITQLGDDINARVQKGDLISQLNLEAGQTLIQSKKLFLDADSVVFSGKAFIPDAAIANLSLDKLTTGHITIPLTDKFGNEIELGREGIEISSLYSSIDRKEPDSSANSTDSSASSNQTDNNAVQAASLMTSFAAIANQPDDSGGSSSNGNIPDQPDNPDHPDTYTTSASYRMRLTADGLRMIQRVHYKNDRDGKENDRDFTELQVSPVNAVGAETTDGANGLAFVTGVDDNDYTTGNQPASFLALGNGKKTNEKGTTLHHLDVIYSATSRSGYPAGMNVNTHLHILPPGADHSIQAVWVSWSNWDGGEKYPALVQDGANWGGVAFPKSGRVTLFDANGRYYSPDRNTGIGPYNNYGG